MTQTNYGPVVDFIVGDELTGSLPMMIQKSSISLSRNLEQVIEKIRAADKDNKAAQLLAEFINHNLSDDGHAVDVLSADFDASIAKEITFKYTISRDEDGEHHSIDMSREKGEIAHAGFSPDKDNGVVSTMPATFENENFADRFRQMVIDARVQPSAPPSWRSRAANFFGFGQGSK
ncbi:MAG: hypothetical protein EBQ89_09655 [Alphaproteobacteria bacterium]|nr:hypothetical protein [Alphaproteobacteria bacterium]